MMTLSEIAEYCPGFRLFFKPIPGWGWKPPVDNASLSFEVVSQSGAIVLEAQAAFQWQGRLRGVYGSIGGEGHVLYGYHFILWPMGDGVVDPEDKKDNHRWDLFFSRQPFREDFVDFSDQDEAGVGYGIPSLKSASPALSPVI